MRIRPEKVDMLIALLFIVVSIFVYYSSNSFTMGGDIFPRYLSIVILILSTILLVDAYRRHKKLTTSEKMKSFGKVENMLWAIRPYIAFLIILLYVFLIPKLGYFVMTGVFTVGMMYYLGVRKVKLYVVTLVGLIAGVYFLFVVQLNVPVPKGLFF